MKDICTHFAALLGFALLCFIVNIYGTIIIWGDGSIATAQENAELQQEIDNPTSHLSGAFSTAAPEYDHLPTDTKSATIAPEVEIPSKTQKDNELDIQNINSHLSGSISQADPGN